MSNSDTINQQQERAEKVTQMDSMCVMVKGKQTSFVYPLWLPQRGSSQMPQLLPCTLHLLTFFRPSYAPAGQGWS